MTDGNQQPTVEVTTERPAGMPTDGLAGGVLEAPEHAPPVEATRRTEPVEFVDWFALQVAAHPEYERDEFPDVLNSEIRDSLVTLGEAVRNGGFSRRDTRALWVAGHPDRDAGVGDSTAVDESDVRGALDRLQETTREARERRETAFEQRQEALKQARKERAHAARERAEWVADSEGK